MGNQSLTQGDEEEDDPWLEAITCTEQDETITCNLGNLPVGDTATIALVVVPSAVATLATERPEYTQKEHHPLALREPCNHGVSGLESGRVVRRRKLPNRPCFSGCCHPAAAASG